MMMRLRHIGILSMLLVALALHSGCDREVPAYKKVSLYPKGQETVFGDGNGQVKAPFRVAIAVVVSPRETVQSYDLFLGYLSGRLGRPVELVQRPTYAEVNDLVRYGSVDMALVCTNAYVQGREDFGMELLVAPEVNGQAVYYSYIIVPADSRIQGFDELRGKVFAFSDPMSYSGRLYPVYVLALQGETPESFFKRYVFTYSHDNSVKAVAEKLVDGAAVDSLVFEAIVDRDPRIGELARVIGRSGPVGTPPVVVHPALNPALKQQLKSILLSMHEDPEGGKALQKIGISRFVEVGDEAYDPIREMNKVVGSVR